jgi:hypothetical protein
MLDKIQEAKLLGVEEEDTELGDIDRKSIVASSTNGASSTSSAAAAAGADSMTSRRRDRTEAGLGDNKSHDANALADLPRGKQSTKQP